MLELTTSRMKQQSLHTNMVMSKNSARLALALYVWLIFPAVSPADLSSEPCSSKQSQALCESLPLSSQGCQLQSYQDSHKPLFKLPWSHFSGRGPGFSDFPFNVCLPYQYQGSHRLKNLPQASHSHLTISLDFLELPIFKQALAKGNPLIPKGFKTSTTSINKASLRVQPCWHFCFYIHVTLYPSIKWWHIGYFQSLHQWVNALPQSLSWFWDTDINHARQS